MKGSNYSVACIVLLALVCGVHCADIMEGNNYNVTALCELLPTGTKLASLESCSNYYECQKKGPVALACDKKQYYDKSKQACVDASSYKCPLELSTDELCAGKNNVYIANNKVCGGWVYCGNNKASVSGFCANGQILIDGKCNYGTCDEVNLCDVIAPGVYFGDNEDCTTWQKCTANGQIKTGTCPTDTKYNVVSGMCEYGDVDCSRVPE